LGAIRKFFAQAVENTFITHFRGAQDPPMHDVGDLETPALRQNSAKSPDQSDDVFQPTIKTTFAFGRWRASDFFKRINIDASIRRRLRRSLR
jgi:hypothetical protein